MMRYFPFSASSRAFSTASRMNCARLFFPTSASMRSGTSAGSRTRIGVTFIGGLPIRRGLSDIGKRVKGRLLKIKAISLIDYITDIAYTFNHKLIGGSNVQVS